MMEHGLIIIYIIYFRSDLTNSLYDGIENILFIYKLEISFSYTIVILFAFSCKLSYITLTLMVNLFFCFYFILSIFLKLNSFLSQIISKNNSLHILLSIIINNKKFVIIHFIICSSSLNKPSFGIISSINTVSFSLVVVTFNLNKNSCKSTSF